MISTECTTWYVYVLQLENYNQYHVNFTHDFSNCRINYAFGEVAVAEHAANNKPKRLVESHAVKCSKQYAIQCAKNMTRKYMRIYGINHVRGTGWTSPKAYKHVTGI